MTDVTHPDTPTRNNLCTTVTTQLNNGTIAFTVGEGGPIASDGCTFAATAFAPPSGGVAIANPITPDSFATGNPSPVSYADLRSSGGTSIVRCDVTTSGGGGDIIISSTQIDAGDTVDVTSLQYTAAP